MSLDGKLCSKWQSRFLRWALWSICWPTYILYRSFVIGQIKYDRGSGTMIIRPRNILTKRLAMILKLGLFFLDMGCLHYFVMAIYPFLPISHIEMYRPQFLLYLVEALAFQISFWNIFRLYHWLHSLTWNRSFVRLANEVIQVISSVKATLGPLPLEGMVLLIIYLTQLEFTVLQLINYIQGRLFLFVPNILLLEMFYNAYVAYLLVVLSCMALLNRLLESYLSMDLPPREHRLKILQLLHFYSRLNNSHQEIIVLWLPVASVLFSGIVMMVCHGAAIICIILFRRDLDTVGKWNSVVHGHLGGGLAPFLKVLFIGLCNDRLALLERTLNLQLLIIDLYYSRTSRPSESLDRELSDLNSCFDLQLRAQPIRIRIVTAQMECGCPFVLDFIFCILLNALGYVQYGMSIGKDLYNFREAWNDLVK